MAATLVAAAAEVASRAYAPYSGLAVGAALLGQSGRVYAACNVENASYGLSICAERAAVFAATAAGERLLRAVAVVGGPAAAQPTVPAALVAALPGAPVGVGECLPCGACRQVLVEFCDDDTPVLTLTADGTIRRRRLGDLLPDAFRLPPRSPR